MRDVPLWLQASGTMDGITPYASLFEPEITRLDLHALPKTHRNGPIYMNVRRFLDMPQAVAVAAEKSRCVIYQQGDQGWDYPSAVAEKMNWQKRFQLRKPVPVE